MQSVRVVGAWNLISAKAQNPNDDVIYLYGENPFGMLMYDTKGYMSVLLMRTGRAKFVSGDPLGGSSEEIKEAFEGFDAYCGTYEVNAKEG
ncbi:MAG: lipocalin-like domain-containing protein, partial [Desulfobacterales bacterium]